MPNFELAGRVPKILRSLYEIKTADAVDMRVDNPAFEAEVDTLDRKSLRLNRGAAGYWNSPTVRIFELAGGQEHIALVTTPNTLARTAEERDNIHLHTTYAALELIGLPWWHSSSTFNMILSAPALIQRKMITSGLVTEAWTFHDVGVNAYVFTANRKGPKSGPEGLFVSLWNLENQQNHPVFYTLNSAGREILGA